MREQETEAAPNQKLPLFVKSIFRSEVHRPIHAEQCDWEAFSRADGGSESEDRSAHLWLALEQSDREVVHGSRVMSYCRPFRSRISNPQPNPQKVCLI